MSLTSGVKINVVFIHADHVTSRGKIGFISVRGVDIHHLQRKLHREYTVFNSRLLSPVVFRAKPICCNSLQML